MTQPVAAGILGAVGLATAAAAAVVIWFVLHEPVLVAETIARLM
jgi:hypothetical protein